MSKRLHLPRFGQSTFNESGQLLFFYVLSSYWAIYALINERFLTSLDGLWTGYPHTTMPFWIKVFLIVQVCLIFAWLHLVLDQLLAPQFSRTLLPKSQKEPDFQPRLLLLTVFHRCLWGLFHEVRLRVSHIFRSSFSKLTLILLILHYVTDSFFHFARIMKFYSYNSIATLGYDCDALSNSVV